MSRGRPTVDQRPAGRSSHRSGQLSTSGAPMTPALVVSSTAKPPTSTGVRRQGASQPAPCSVSDVAAWFALVASAEEALADELDWIGGCRAPVCTETVTRLERLLDRLRVAARVRGELAVLDPALLRAGGAVWVQQRAVGRVRWWATSTTAGWTSVRPGAGQRPGAVR